ncbi:MAG TPA: hypothetical protein VGO62_16110 [Myxococcota bacterium]|jgi:hypothetical protein
MARLLALMLVLLAGVSCANKACDRGEIQGEVCEARGHPLARSLVSLDGVATHTDDDGHFRALGMKPGMVSVHMASRTVDVMVNEGDIAVVFDAQCRASGLDAPPFARFTSG